MFEIDFLIRQDRPYGLTDPGRLKLDDAPGEEEIQPGRPLEA